jgi:uncharacterized phage protein (TIGR01671 family)
MNRPIKFRVWDFFHKQWITGAAIELNGCIINTSFAEPETNCVALQYTGLTDKNGKEIFEGDIIIDTQKQKYEIIFDENHARYDLKVCGENKLSQTSYFTQIYEKKHIEVIGNIFEHSELLN